MSVENYPALSDFKPPLGMAAGFSTTKFPTFIMNGQKM